MPRSEASEFVHVVASVDVKAGTGAFLYVNPTSAPASAAQGAAPPPGLAPEGDLELAIEDGQGGTLDRFPATVLFPTDVKDPAAGIVDQIIPVMPGMKRVVLFRNGKEIARFEAGAPLAVSGGAAATAQISMGAAPPGKPEKRSFSLDAIDAEPGVTYTVQVRPEGDARWRTIAVGRSTPDATIDRNQFPGAARATVRVLRSTGFNDDVVAEEEMDLGLDE